MNRLEAAFYGVVFVSSGIVVLLSWRNNIHTWRKIIKSPETGGGMWTKLGLERPKSLTPVHLFMVDWMPRVLGIICLLSGVMMLFLSFKGR